MTYLPDPEERMEARAELMAEELYHNGRWHCCNCGDSIVPGYEQTMSADPAAPPVCPQCFRQAVEKTWGKDALANLDREFRSMQPKSDGQPDEASGNGGVDAS